jgi:lipopolysaccharide export system permease protein
MKVVERYILSRAVLLFLGTLVSTLLIVWIVQALTRINLITTNGQSTLVFLKISTLILPSIIPEVLPFAIAIAVVQTLVAMNTDSELVIISAAGSPRTAVMRPVLLLALAGSILSFAVTNVIDPYARLQFRKMIGAARGDLISVVLQEGAFRQLAKGLYIQIGERLAGGDLGGVFVADSRNENIDLVYYAKKGSLADAGPTKMLLMRDGMIQRKKVGGDISVVRFQSYAFDLSQFGPAGDSVSLFPRDRSLAFLLDPDPDDTIYKRIPGEFRAELHRRLAEWLFPLVFALIGLAVAGDARSHRESRISPLITVVLLALIVRWAAFVAVDRAEKSASLVAMIYGVPLMATAVAIRFILANRTLELPVRLIDVVSSAFRRTNDGLLLFGMRVRRLAIPERRHS